ncbi:hypothetical protein [Oryza sativa Japonica Group]|uniref:Uncharacterized protein n=1 Tax=Oryza sativa subsp. japonica TaxID=39947 RepID=Q8LR97_ORYSJ|nr:hypothetical protein [Oryza sativa Japonica Group]
MWPLTRSIASSLPCVALPRRCRVAADEVHRLLPTTRSLAPLPSCGRQREYAIGARISFVPCHSVSSVHSSVVFSARRRSPPVPVSAAPASVHHRHRPSSSASVVVIVVHGSVGAEGRSPPPPAPASVVGIVVVHRPRRARPCQPRRCPFAVTAIVVLHRPRIASSGWSMPARVPCPRPPHLPPHHHGRRPPIVHSCRIPPRPTIHKGLLPHPFPAAAPFCSRSRFARSRSRRFARRRSRC